jgi:hypothetical protein
MKKKKATKKKALKKGKSLSHTKSLRTIRPNGPIELNPQPLPP